MGDDSGFQVAGVGPDAYEQHVRVFMTPLVEAMLDRVEPGDGESVLDVACGTGFATRAALQRVGAAGRVVGADINAAMLDLARGVAPAKATNIEFVEASAQSLPFDDGTFDVTVCQQGVQFFPDLTAAVAELARVTRPGGRVAATAWTPLTDSPFMHAQYTALSEALGEDAVASFAAAFAMTDERLRAAFEAAGLTDVTVEVVAPEVRLPPPTRYVPDQIAATPWGPAFAAAGAAVRKSIARRVADLLLEDTVDGSPIVPFSTWLVTGSR